MFLIRNDEIIPKEAFCRTVESLTNMSLLPITSNRRFQRQISVPLGVDLHLDTLREQSDRALRRCFSFFKSQTVTAMDICDIALSASCLSLTEYKFISELIDCEMKMEKVLKFVIKKGKQTCFKFIKQLYILNHSSIIAVLLTHKQDTDTDIGENGILTTQFLQNETECLCNNIKIKTLLDMLFERGVLTVDEHDVVQRHKRRKNKRRELLGILFNKPNDEWLICFLRCLQLTGHEGMLRELRARRGQRRGTQIWHEQHPQYLAYISNVNEQDQDLPRDENDDRIETIALSEEKGVIDIWEGSLYLLLYTAHPEKMNALLVEKDIEKLRILLGDMFNGNPSLVNKFGVEKVLKFELEERRGHGFLNKNQGRKPMVDTMYRTEDCLHCFLETVHGNYAEILDEIEDDIIEDVIARCPNMSTYAKQLCSDVKKTRVETATVLLQLALANDFILDGLRNSLRLMSSAKFIPFKCQICKKGSLNKVICEEAEKATFFFRLQKLENGTVKIVMISEEKDNKASLLPPSSRRLIRSQSVHHLSLNIESSNKKRLVLVTGESDRLIPEVERIENLFNKNFTAYTLPVCSRNELDDISRLNCIIHMSPGPHAFLVVCDSSNVSSLGSRIQELVRHFGDNVLRYILVVCVIKGRTSVKADAEVRKLPIFHKLGNGCLLVTADPVQNDELLSTLRRKMDEIHTGLHTDYFTNDCFEKLEMYILQEKKTRDNITQYKIEYYQDRIQSLKQLNSRQEATKEVAKFLICNKTKNQKTELDSC